MRVLSGFKSLMLFGSDDLTGRCWFVKSDVICISSCTEKRSDLLQDSALMLIQYDDCLHALDRDAWTVSATEVQCTINHMI